MEIKYLKREEIDKTKWNSCVHYATNGNIYGYMWYLDTVAKEWDGLIEGDYESVLPLFTTERPDTLQQPELIRQAGIYSIHLLSAKRVAAFLGAIPEQYKNYTFQFNEGIRIPESFALPSQEQFNYQLLLTDPYEKVREHFFPKTIQALEQAEDADLLPASNLKPEKIAALFRETVPQNPKNEMAFHAYQRIMYNALHRGWGSAQGITDRAGNLLAATFILYSHGRALLLLAPVNPLGRQKGADLLMIDNIIRSHAGRPILLDFNTGQALPERFGAQRIPYARIAQKTKQWWKVW